MEDEAVVKETASEREKREAEIERLHDWIDDLQSGMYVNCVYCGYRYGPRESTPSSMADILETHVGKCPKHPMSALRKKNEALEKALKKICRVYESGTGSPCYASRLDNALLAARKLVRP